MDKNRCGWAKDSYDIDYHDNEWGKEQHDDQMLFEFLILEGMQAGLSWNTILRKRDNFRKAFDGFDVNKVATYDEDKIQDLLQDAGIIRNRLKIRGTVKNANAFLAVQKEFGSFDTYLWGFVNYKPIINHFHELQEVPTKTELSDSISKDMKKRGFTFVGSTIIYAYMQAIGMVNDHLTTCFVYNEK